MQSTPSLSLAHQRWNNPQKFCEEVVTWKYLKHPNIVPLQGVTITPSPQLISDWILGESLTEYIKNNPGEDRLGLVGVLHALDS